MINPVVFHHMISWKRNNNEGVFREVHEQQETCGRGWCETSNINIENRTESSKHWLVGSRASNTLICFMEFSCAKGKGHWQNRTQESAQRIKLCGVCWCQVLRWARILPVSFSSGKIRLDPPQKRIPFHQFGSGFPSHCTSFFWTKHLGQSRQKKRLLDTPGADPHGAALGTTEEPSADPAEPVRGRVVHPPFGRRRWLDWGGSGAGWRSNELGKASNKPPWYHIHLLKIEHLLVTSILVVSSPWYPRVFKESSKEIQG